MAVDFARVDNDDYASRSSTGFNHNAAYTALTWFKIDTNPAQYQHFVNISGSYAYDGNTDFIGTDEVTPILFRYGCAGGASSSFLTSGVLTVGVWYWCALVRESSTSLKVYRGTNSSDGALIATLTNNVGARASASLMSLGGYNSANINGPIALPRFWSGSSLTLAQLHAEVGSYSPVITANLWTAPAFSGADFTAAMADLSGNARNWTRSGTDSTIVADPISPSSGASQSIAFTLDGVASAVSQTLSHSQTLATTLDGVTVAVSQGLRHAQTLSATLDSISVSASQTLRHPQSLAIALDGVAATINQSIGSGNSQAIAFVLDGIAAAVAQTLTHPQSFSATLDGVSVAATQVARHPQALTFALDGVAVSIAQGLQHSQTLAATLDGIAVQIAQEFSSPNKDQALAITLDDVSVRIVQTNPDGVVLLGGGPGGPKKKKRVVRTELDKDSYLYRLLSPEVREKIEPEAAEVIEAKAVEVVEQKAKPSPKAVRVALADEGVAYRQAYKEIYLELIGEIRKAQADEEEEEESIAMALLL